MSIKARVKTVLIVDDDEDSLFALKLMLESQGLAVAAFTSSLKALDSVDSTKPDLVLVDLMMPQMDGFALIRELKKKPTMHSVPIVVVTAREEENDIEEVFERGADYYITKPFTAKQLESRIQLYLTPSDDSQKPAPSPTPSTFHRPRGR